MPSAHLSTSLRVSQLALMGPCLLSGQRCQGQSPAGPDSCQGRALCLAQLTWHSHARAGDSTMVSMDISGPVSELVSRAVLLSPCPAQPTEQELRANQQSRLSPARAMGESLSQAGTVPLPGRLLERAPGHSSGAPRPGDSE